MLDAIMEFLAHFAQWEWWAVVGIALLISEILVPSVILVWPGLAAVCVALFTAIFNTNWHINWILFAILTVVFLVIGRKMWRKSKSQKDHYQLNLREQQLIGRYCTIVEATNYEKGRVSMGDTTWLARTEPSYGVLQPETPVKVIAVEGTTLIVQPETLPVE